MGYSRSPATVFKHERVLAPLAKVSAWPVYTWTVPRGVQPAAFALKIRECLNIIHANPEMFPALAPAAKLFATRQLSICVIGRFVQALYSTPEEPEPTPSDTLFLDTAASAPEIIQAWIDRQPSDLPLHVKKVNLSVDDHVELGRWATNVGWSVQTAGEGLILSPKVVSS